MGQIGIVDYVGGVDQSLVVRCQRVDISRMVLRRTQVRGKKTDDGKSQGERGGGSHKALGDPLERESRALGPLDLLPELRHEICIYRVRLTSRVVSPKQHIEPCFFGAATFRWHHRLFHTKNLPP